ncbi:hypothetical protein [Hymenobacter sp. CRA2]|uniref:hypothetical protein n=1 Tax=Hymenobacter sp. CRA2 TaxID=1955620 RepID=UPI00098FA196|nr:hypothetical protein [Hymenobacter sp. CRA2]OON67742.1 hypothetical protein B0919_16200 [Hymenobacter sp. CRA2]
MTRFFLLGGLLAAAPLLAQAQAPDTTARRYELGLTASPQLDHFFTGNRALPVGLLYRRPLGPTKALRLRVVGQYARQDTSDYAGQLAGSGRRAWELTALAGYEWQRPLARRWQLCYGAELGAGLGRTTSRVLRETPNTNGVGTYATDLRYVGEYWQAQARPFVGLRLHLGSAISLFAEAAAPLSYVRRRDDYTIDIVRQNTAGSLVRASSFYTSKRLGFVLRPVQLVGLSFRF